VLIELGALLILGATLKIQSGVLVTRLGRVGGVVGQRRERLQRSLKMEGAAPSRSSQTILFHREEMGSTRAGTRFGSQVQH
jgi:hypothetical protein